MYIYIHTHHMYNLPLCVYYWQFMCIFMPKNSLLKCGIVSNIEIDVDVYYPWMTLVVR